MINGFLLTETYSKDTDIHQYLHPSSCHPQHIFKGIPKALGIRIRRNCSDRYDGDSKFIKNLREFKGYMITSGYKEEVVDQAFGTLANISRKSILWKKTNATRKKRTARKYRFVTSHEPAFPDIKKILLKHQHIILEDDELKKVFPNGAKDFRRGAKNLKELLAKSKIATLEVEDQNGRRQANNKNCACCEMLRKTASHEFKSLRTGCRYKIRQNITCESKDIVYLVACNKHNIQGAGCTTISKAELVTT